MSFLKYLSISEKIKYVLLALIGAVIGIGAVILGIKGRLDAWVVLMIVTSVFVPIASQALKIKTSALKKIPPEQLFQKEKKDLKETEEIIKLGESFKYSKQDKMILALTLVTCSIFAFFGYLYIKLRYPEIWRIITRSE